MQKSIQSNLILTANLDKTATDRLIVEEFFAINPLKLPANAWKDHKKLTRFLQDVTDYVNKIIRACQIQSRLIATELVARPTYAEEFQNIRNKI